jgi:hypothetical protein
MESGKSDALGTDETAANSAQDAAHLARLRFDSGVTDFLTCRTANAKC